MSAKVLTAAIWRNPFRVVNALSLKPRVASQARQPWALRRNPFGILLRRITPPGQRQYSGTQVACLCDFASQLLAYFYSEVRPWLKLTTPWIQTQLILLREQINPQSMWRNRIQQKNLNTKPATSIGIGIGNAREAME